MPHTVKLAIAYIIKMHGIRYIKSCLCPCLVIMQLEAVTCTHSQSEVMLVGLAVAVREDCVQEGRCGLRPGFSTGVWTSGILLFELC